MTPEARAKLRELAMAAGTRRPWKVKDENTVVACYGRQDVLIADLNDSVCDNIANAAYIAAVHPGTIIEMLDALDAAERR